jgi:hypothetical protein
MELLKMNVSMELMNKLSKCTEEVVYKCVKILGEKYNFDAEEGMLLLNLGGVNVMGKVKGKGKGKGKGKEKVNKLAFPLPYNGELKEEYCYALRQNNGLYTQCQGMREGEKWFCKGCENKMQKNGDETPEYGTIQDRMRVGLLEYVDPKGRKPVSYTKIMKKYKLSKEDVLAEAAKMNMIVNEEHFELKETKRGRPKSEKPVKEKGVKGRPKKSEITLEIQGEESSKASSFKELVREAVEKVAEEVAVDVAEEVAEEEKVAVEVAEVEKVAEEVAVEVAVEVEKVAEVAVVESVIVAKADKQAKKAEKEALKQLEKAAKAEAEKAEKAAKAEAEKAEKAAKKEAEKAEKAAKKEAEKAEKAAKVEAEKAAKKEAVAKELAAKEEKKEKKEVAKEEVAKEEKKEEENTDVLKRLIFSDKKYLKSKKTGIVYDYEVYIATGDCVVVGKWSEETQEIIFDDEVSEEEYDSGDDSEESEEEYM